MPDKQNFNCVVGFHLLQDPITDENKTPCLSAGSSTGEASLGVCEEQSHAQYIVRRLTPLECERLQGFPDGWTDIGEWTDSKGKVHKESTDSARYTNYTQAALEAAIKAGKFMFHSVNGTVRVLEDINTLVTLTAEKGEIFQSNQTIRVCDQIANDVAVLFNTRYVGIVPNDASGRATLWNDIVKLIQQLETLRAVEDFDLDTVSVDIGDRKGSVLLTIDGLNIVNAMSQLYMSVIIQ